MVVGNTTNGSPNITSIIGGTDNLFPGMFIHHQNVPIDTKILSITNDTTLVMTKNATVTTVAIILDINCASSGIQFEANCAKMEIETSINERGTGLIFKDNNNETVTRDRLNSIIHTANTPALMIKAFPVQFDPTRRQIEAASRREITDVNLFTPMASWDNLGLDVDQVRTEFARMVLIGETYKIEEVSVSSHFSETFLYMTFGLNKDA